MDLKRITQAFANGQPGACHNAEISDETHLPAVR